MTCPALTAADAALTTPAAALTAECARSGDCGLPGLPPASRSAVGCWHGDTAMPRRVHARLNNYLRYFAGGWPGPDHAGQLPPALFVFETQDAGESFLRAAAAQRRPVCTSNLELVKDFGALREVWRWPPPNAPDRLPLHRLGEGCKNVPSRSGRFR